MEQEGESSDDLFTDGSVESDDDKYGTDPDWRNIVQREHEKAVTENDERRIVNIRVAWQQNSNRNLLCKTRVENAAFRREEKAETSQPPAPKKRKQILTEAPSRILPHKTIGQDAKFAILSSDIVASDGSLFWMTTKHPIIPIPPVNRPPKFTSYTTVVKNYGVNDTFQTLPCFDDGVIDRNIHLVHKVGREILEFNRKHEKNNSNKIEDDNVFFNLIRKLNSIEKRGGFSGGGEDFSAERKYLPTSVVINAVFKQFPGEDDIHRRYIKLLRERDPTAAADIPAYTIVNIDGPNPGSYDPAQALRALRSVFCRKCFIYGCTLHTGEDERVSPEFITKLGAAIPELKPCRLDCWLLKDAKSLIGPYVRPEDWTGGDDTLCRTLQKVFVDNFCIIADTMQKDCNQVRAFMLSETPGEPVPEIVPAKRRRRSHSLKAAKSPKRVKVSKRSHSGVVWKGQRLDTVRNSAFKPCFHPGISCSDCDFCICRVGKVPCEKFCCCARDCRKRIQGCRCKVGKCIANSCFCYASGRECDPDLCKGCGASEYDLEKINCKNVSIQKLKSKRLKVGVSSILGAGLGVFAAEDVDKNELIEEYVGEIITTEEADRRGEIYRLRGSTFVFDLNKEYAVDGTRFGSKIRFANHSPNPNANFKVMTVMCDHRIGVYANRKIIAGEEIFVSYPEVIKENLEVAEQGKVDG